MTPTSSTDAAGYNDGAERAAWVAEHEVASAPVVARQVCAAVQRVVVPACVRTECFVTVVATEAAVARQAREAGGGVAGRAQVLYTALAEVEAQLLGGVGAVEVEWLTSAGLAAAIRTGFAPGDRAGIVAAGLAHRSRSSENLTVAAPHDGAGGAGEPVVVTAAAAGPAGARCQPRSWTHDGWVSVSDTFGLPAQGARMGALAPVLAPSTAGERRCLTVFFPVVSPQRAARLVSRRANAATIAAGVRARLQVQVSTSEQVEVGRTRDMDVKLVRGRALVRPAAVATVTVPAGWSVGEYGRRLDAAIRGAGFSPQRLDLAQDAGFVAGVIPVGVGVPVERSVR